MGNLFDTRWINASPCATNYANSRISFPDGCRHPGAGCGVFRPGAEHAARCREGGRAARPARDGARCCADGRPRAVQLRIGAEGAGGVAGAGAWRHGAVLQRSEDGRPRRHQLDVRTEQQWRPADEYLSAFRQRTAEGVQRGAGAQGHDLAQYRRVGPARRAGQQAPDHHRQRAGGARRWPALRAVAGAQRGAFQRGDHAAERAAGMADRHLRRQRSIHRAQP